MKLTFSKSRFVGGVYAFSMVVVLLLVAGVFFFDIMMAHPGSDFSNNLNSIKAASAGSYWSHNNTPQTVFAYLLELHFYFWTGYFGKFFDDKATLLRLITLSVTFLLIYPTLFSAGRLKNKILLFVLLFVLFMHPRFLDLVIGNIRSASALVFMFYALQVNRTIIKFFLMGVAATFHLALLAPIFLYLVHLFWRRLPQSRSNSGLLFWMALLAPGILIMAAKVVFPQRGSGDWEGGIVYTISIFILAAYTFFIGKNRVNNEFAFVSLGLMSLVLWGGILGYATMRYFSFFFPFFAVMMLAYDRRPQVLILTITLWLLFAIASHSTWLLSL